MGKKVALTAAGVAALTTGAVATTQTVHADTVATSETAQSTATVTPAQKAQSAVDQA